MRRLLVLVAAVGLTFTTFTPMAAAQARPSATLSGNDISFPQCGKTYPSGQAFGIVGVNGGKASTFDGHRHKHHEIYLGDPRRSAPERLRTIIRQPYAAS